MIDVVFDISHHNGPGVDFVKARAAGMVGVLHKASQGLNYADPMYASNRPRAVAAGLYWGAYHFGTGDDGAAQADHFLAAMGDRTNVLMVLDFEPNTTPHETTMDLPQARAFVQRVHDQTGKWPGLYSGSYLGEQLGNAQDPLLANCWLWLARYADQPPKVPANWPHYTMWQYADDQHNVHPLDGVGACDRNRFNGNLAQLKAIWGIA